MCTLKSFVFFQLFSLPHLICCCWICCFCALVFHETISTPFPYWIQTEIEIDVCVCVCVCVGNPMQPHHYLFSTTVFVFLSLQWASIFFSIFAKTTLLTYCFFSLSLFYCRTFQMTFSSCCCWLFV